MKTTTLTTADGREIRVHHAEDWSGQARLRFAPDSNQGDIHLPGWVARGLCRREPQCCADSRANLLARAEQAERERDEARYWLAAHKAASEALVDPITGHGFFMLIGKGDDGVDGWFYTFGGPFDSYTLCERSDDEDPHFVYFHRERYDHDQGGWADGVEVVEPVLAPDECSVAPYCLEEVTEERDALKAKLAEAERDLMGVKRNYNVLYEMADKKGKALRARLAKAEAVVEAARKWAAGDLQYHGHTGLKHDVLAALRALEDSPRAIVDSDTAAVGAVDSTPGTPGLASGMMHMKWTTESGEVRYLAVHALPAWGGGSQYDISDITACLAANPEAAAEVIRGLEPRCCADSRANLLARAEQAERERDQWRAKWEALETTRASCCDQMDRERDEARDTAALDEIRAQQRLESLAHDHAKAVAERDEARAMFQETRRRMCRRMGQEEGKSWSALESLASALRSRLAKTDAVVEAARTDLRTADILIEGAHAGAGGTTAERLEQATRGIRAALRALDNDSGGSGAAAGNTPTQVGEQPGGGDTTSGDTRPPEPAGSSPRAIVDSDTAAVGAVDSTPGTPGLASLEPGDAGSNPVRSGSSGTPGPTVGAIPAAGATEPEPAGSSMDAGGFSVEPCGTRCDHGSPCTLQRDHLPACRHETEHGCICYDPEPNPKRCGANLWPASPTPCALPRGHEGVHDTYAPGIKPPSLRETHATTRREVEELRRRVGRLENLVDKL